MDKFTATVNGNVISSNDEGIFKMLMAAAFTAPAVKAAPAARIKRTAEEKAAADTAFLEKAVDIDTAAQKTALDLYARWKNGDAAVKAALTKARVNPFGLPKAAKSGKAVPNLAAFLLSEGSVL